MEKYELCGQEIWECANSDEARRVWVEFPDDRHRIWTVDEIKRYMFAGVEDVLSVLKKKEEKAGVY